MARAFGAMLFYGAANLNLPQSANGTAAGQYAWTRNGLGDVSLNNAAGISTVQFWANIADYKRPYFTFPAFPGQGSTSSGVVPSSNEYNEAFGTSTGTPGNPYSGGVQSFFGTPAFAAGMAVVDIFAVYSVQTAGLTTATIGLNRATYTENAAFTNTAVVAATGIALTTTTGAGTPHVQKVALAQPLLYESADISDLGIELVITTAGTSAVRVYGLGCHVVAAFS